MSVAYRPSHADATYDMKYGVRSVQVITFFFVQIIFMQQLEGKLFSSTYYFKCDVFFKGGGRSSARETIGRVAPGALAKKILKQFAGTEVCLLSGFANIIAFRFESRLINPIQVWFMTKGYDCLCLSFVSPDSCLCLPSPPSCTSRGFGRPRESDTRTGATFIHLTLSFS